MKGATVGAIPYSTAKDWIVRLHYAKRVPSISYAFGLFYEGKLSGVITYGSPASPFLAMGVCGVDWRSAVVELNRLVILESGQNFASFLIGKSLQMLPRPSIVVSYADVGMGHVGYVYQATNFIYTGATKPRTDIFSKSGHARHHSGDRAIRQNRTAKHRYIFFVGDKRERRKMRLALNYPEMEYPKGDIRRYKVDATVIPYRQIRMKL